MAIVKVTDSNFDENIQSGVKLVDFGQLGVDLVKRSPCVRRISWRL